MEQIAGQEFGSARELSGDSRILGLDFIRLAEEGPDAIGRLRLAARQGAAGELAKSLPGELGAHLIGAMELGLL